MIPTELKNIEMKLDREKLEEQKNKEQYVRNKLDKMQPCLQFRLPLGKRLETSPLQLINDSLAIDLGSSYKQAKGQGSNEEQTQKQRESTIFQQIYLNPNLIPVNPLKELDEVYVKDDKGVIQHDSEEIANEWFKKRDDDIFEKELTLLQQELASLE
jgi:hypothetical protein